MNSNLHFLTKQFRNIRVIIATILLCFYCNIEAEKQSKYYNLTGALQHPTDVLDLDLEPRDLKTDSKLFPRKSGTCKSYKSYI
ncbi:hypothetical protein [Leptospira noguchii]|uniref:Uncharacterized protein n=1 Tax=Leptospira noguchii TaxID=28182 RepID=A0AAE9KBD3_9LEPT|nr:hypothetical protein [Leptospira noguchii]UOG57587.1 hypothetical protein MAL03_05470 [Leptospira noguchii]